ncbi:hypothetical protein CPB86DRAFT_872506 [Serendipita vermifera]|nr:hypothetical protein CPB86DRAFT_872506 [Serendipita vermifera]
MSYSAVERTPPEVWRIILHHAVASPLLPCTENGGLSSALIHTLQLFSVDCHSFRIYVDDTQATIVRLRLVCRAWAQLLPPDANACAFTDLSSYSFPSEETVARARRLIISTGPVPCPVCLGSEQEWRSCPLTRFQRQWLDQETRKKTMNEPYDFLATCSRSLRVLVSLRDGLSSLEFVRPLSNLVALNFSCERIEELGNLWSMADLSNWFPKLSHLQITAMKRSTHVLVEKVTFPVLRCLSLQLWLEDIFESRAFKEWSFPSLRTFMIDGYFHQRHDKVICEFLSRHGNSITEIGIYHSHPSRSREVNDGNDNIRNRVWTVCPNAVALGIAAFELCSDDATQNWQTREIHLPPLTLVVRHITGFWTSPAQFADVLIELKRKWSIAKVIFSEPWEMVKRNRIPLDGQVSATVSSRETMMNLIRLLEREELPVLDRLHIPLHSALEAILPGVPSTTLA